MQILPGDNRSTLAVGKAEDFARYLDHFSSLSGDNVSVDCALFRFRGRHQVLPPPELLSAYDSLNYVEYATSSRLALRPPEQGSSSLPRVLRVADARSLVIGYLCGMDDKSFVDVLDLLPVVNPGVEFAYFFVQNNFHFCRQTLGFEFPQEFGVVAHDVRMDDTLVEKLARDKNLWQQARQTTQGLETVIEGLIMTRRLKSSVSSVSSLRP